MKLSEILTNARAHISNGWCQGRGMDGQGNVCAVGAVNIAMDRARLAGRNVPFYFEGRLPYEFLNDHLPEFGFHQPQDTICFNDDPLTTKQDVLNLFDKAIASAEEKGL